MPHLLRHVLAPSNHLITARTPQKKTPRRTSRLQRGPNLHKQLVPAARFFFPAPFPHPLGARLNHGPNVRPELPRFPCILGRTMLGRHGTWPTPCGAGLRLAACPSGSLGSEWSNACSTLDGQRHSAEKWRWQLVPYFWRKLGSFSRANARAVLRCKTPSDTCKRMEKDTPQPGWGWVAKLDTIGRSNPLSAYRRGKMPKKGLEHLVILIGSLWKGLPVGSFKKVASIYVVTPTQANSWGASHVLLLGMQNTN